MVGFKGRLGFKQYLPLKPTKWGIKLWVLCEAKSGYTLNFSVYCGKESTTTNARPLGSRVVFELHEVAPVIYGQFLFKSQLFKELLSKKTYACGTVWSNRRGLPPSYSSTANTLKRADRGEQVSFQDGPLLVIAWKDTTVVQMLSTCTTDDVTTVKQRVGLQLKDVPCPTTVVKYNNNMGGVDLSDQLTNLCHIILCHTALNDGG